MISIVANYESSALDIPYGLLVYRIDNQNQRIYLSSVPMDHLDAALFKLTISTSVPQDILDPRF